MGITLGNSKIGSKMTWTWSMPPGVHATCPGESDDCRQHCYAKKGFLGCMPSALKSQQNNYELSKASDFADIMIGEISKRKVSLFRIHVVGDFYSTEYIQKWIKIVKACPSTTFYAYTRSWNVPELRASVNKLSKLPNFRMWWSCDRSMPPPKPPKGVRLAYMQVEHNDTPKYPVNLVFRIKELRKKVEKRVAGVMVCPPENGTTHTTCEKCGWCWKPLYKQPGNLDKRVALPLITV